MIAGFTKPAVEEEKAKKTMKAKPVTAVQGSNTTATVREKRAVDDID
jgi:hypothetical protein